MRRTLDGAASADLSDPERFRRALDGMLVCAAAGTAISVLGAFFVLLAITALRHRKAGMYDFLWCYGMLSLIIQAWVAAKDAPLILACHAPLALFLIVFATVKRQEFFAGWGARCAGRLCTEGVNSSQESRRGE